MRDRPIRRAARRLLPPRPYALVTEVLTQRRLHEVEVQIEAHARAIATLRHPDLAPTGGLHEAELKICSQNGEDGVLLWIFSAIGTTDRKFVEFGIEDGRECNSANLARHWGWSGLLLEGATDYAEVAAAHYANLPVTVRQAFVTPENIQAILSSEGYSDEFDLLSIDIDSSDYWVWAAISARPRVVVIEYNPSFGPEWSVTLPVDPNFTYDYYSHGGIYHGASISALETLASEKGYSLIGCESTGANAFFVRSDCVGALPVVTAAKAWRPNRARPGSLDQQINILRSLPVVEV